MIARITMILRFRTITIQPATTLLLSGECLLFAILVVYVGLLLFVFFVFALFFVCMIPMMISSSILLIGYVVYYSNSPRYS